MPARTLAGWHQGWKWTRRWRAADSRSDGGGMRGLVRRTVQWMMVGAVVLPRGARGQDARSTIAVLPFENSGSYGQDREAFDALAVGLPVILGATLAAHPAVAVVERGRLDQTLDQQKLAAARRVDAGSATEIAKASGAQYAVSGSFTDFYGKVRIKDRKSTRLNSSHMSISYAVFCLKKKI